MPQTYNQGWMTDPSRTTLPAAQISCPCGKNVLHESVSHRDLTCLEIGNKCSFTPSRRWRSEDLLVRDIRFWMWKGEIHCSHCLQLNLYSVIPSSFSLPSSSSAKRPTQWFWGPEQLSAKPDTPNKQQNIAQPVHTGTMHKAVPPGMGSYVWDSSGLPWLFLFPSPFSEKFSKASCTTCPPAKEHTETCQEGDLSVPYGNGLLVEVTLACRRCLWLN